MRNDEELGKTRKIAGKPESRIKPSAAGPGSAGPHPAGSVVTGAETSFPPAGFSTTGIVIQDGAVVTLGKNSYTVVSSFDRPAGESELFLLERDGRKFVLKYYFPYVQPKFEVLDVLMGIRHDFIISPLDCGTLASRFYEVLPFAERGSLADKLPVRDEESLLKITGRVTEALSCCHQLGVLHRDIKPENFLQTGKRVWEIAVSDFGISSLLHEDQTRHLTSQAFTFGYAAPELYGFGGRVYVGKEADFYALGMTLLHLWIGKNPFEGLSAYAISNLTTSGNVRIPEDMPARIRDLVNGLLTTDYRTRWGEREVLSYLSGKVVPIRKRETKAEPGPFIFDSGLSGTITASTPAEAALLLEQSPDLGKKHLYRKTLGEWLFTVDPSLYQKITDLVENEYPGNQSAGLAKAILILDPSRHFKSRRGVVCTTPEEIGAEIDDDFGFYRKELSENPASDFYLFLEARGFETAAEMFRSCFKRFSRAKAFNIVVLSLTGEETFRLGPLRLHTVEEVNGAPDFVRQHLMDQLCENDSRFLVWLERRGFIPSSTGLLNDEMRKVLFALFPWTEPLFTEEGYGNPDSFDGRGYTALHRAVVAGDEKRVGRLLLAGCNPDIHQGAGWTSLHLAARYDRTEICRILLENGASPDLRNRSGETPLHTAAGSGSEGTARLLLDWGARPDLRNSEGLLPYELSRDAELKALLEEKAKLAGRNTIRRLLLVLLPVLMIAGIALAVVLDGWVRASLIAWSVSLGLTFVFFRTSR